MHLPWPRRLRSIGTLVIAAVVVLPVAGFLFAWSGLYSVAASRGHWAIVEWFLTFGMRNSVATHALPIEVPPLDEPNLVRLGAGHFHSGCAYCHGAIGIPINPIAKSMLPAPPDLSRAAREWKSNELFWIVKHGLKYTGMPAWVTQHRDDEVWAVVAFLRKLPQLDAKAYQELALDDVRLDGKSGQELASVESSPQASGACARCHGAGRHGPGSNLVPILHGQSREYLIAALQSYADGARPSGIMQPIASDVSKNAMRELAGYYAGLPQPPPAHREGGDPQSIERGRQLALVGSLRQGIPACETCHGSAALPSYPRLSGQHAPYLVRQLQLWKRGVNTTSPLGAIMAPIAQRLSEQQIQDAAAYFASVTISESERGGARRP